ncbi:hypothetical protein JTE90_025800 [Oedothorax gibbosus]|uniref:Uncharacterized protein n=1 Tax=Oedothorax gibbosus TaxID=931172 RepID=A0AAV6U277_9ARAC|nr:hypothetical protein JTE90_025800 [Oedothorax gibbosus]
MNKTIFSAILRRSLYGGPTDRGTNSISVPVRNSPGTGYKTISENIFAQEISLPLLLFLAANPGSWEAAFSNKP